MSPAPCGHCGGQAISYGAHLVNVRPTRPCDTCGRLVRKRGFWTVLGVAAAVGAGIGYYLFARTPAPEGESWLTLAAVGGLLLVLADYLAWRWLPWEPVGEGLDEWDLSALEGPEWEGPEGDGWDESGPPESVESREHT